MKNADCAVQQQKLLMKKHVFVITEWKTNYIVKLSNKNFQNFVFVADAAGTSSDKFLGTDILWKEKSFLNAFKRLPTFGSVSFHKCFWYDQKKFLPSFNVVSSCITCEKTEYENYAETEE